MNRNELVKELEKQMSRYGYCDTWTHIEIFIKEYEALTKDKNQTNPKKVKVSEEEAKFLKTFDFNCGSDVTTALYHVSRTGWGYYLKDNDGIELKDLSEGFRELENRKRLIKAILDGYEVEKEKRYIIKLKGVSNGTRFLKYGKNIQAWYFGEKGHSSDRRIRHTRKELEKAGFSWVFDCPGIEIEEVE